MLINACECDQQIYKPLNYAAVWGFTVSVEVGVNGLKSCVCGVKCVVLRKWSETERFCVCVCVCVNSLITQISEPVQRKTAAFFSFYAHWKKK